MSITSKELNGNHIYELSDVRTMAGLNAVRRVVLLATNMEPVDGSVILAESQGFPHAEIVFPQPVPLDIIAGAEEIGATEISRTTEVKLR
jgi:hypothetical protein